MEKEKKIRIVMKTKVLLGVLLYMGTSTHPMPEIVSEEEIACEGIGECMIEFQDFKESISLDAMDIAISQGSDVTCRLTDVDVFPECIPKDVSFPFRKDSYKEITRDSIMTSFTRTRFTIKVKEI